MNELVQGLIFAACWFSGIYIFDSVLELRGGWMMTAGVCTFFLAGIAAGIVEVN